LALHDALRQHLRRDRNPVSGAKRKARRRAKATFRRAAAEKDSVRRAQNLFLAMMQHFACHKAGDANATDARRLCAQLAAVKWAKATVGQMGGSLCDQGG
jgi:hypothetical protein